VEIKNVIDNNKKMYPTIDQIDNKKLKKNIPNKWLKLGMSTSIFALLIKKRSLATSISDIQPLAGDIMVTAGVQAKPALNTTLPVISIFMIILSTILGIRIKSKRKKGINESRIVKVLRLISIILTILVLIQTIIYLNDYYGWIYL